MSVKTERIVSAILVAAVEAVLIYVSASATLTTTGLAVTAMGWYALGSWCIAGLCAAWTVGLVLCSLFVLAMVLLAPDDDELGVCDDWD